MAEYVIDGGRRLNGCIEIQGAKNSALPILAASVLCRGEVILNNCPIISDTDTCIKILRYLGCSVYRDGHTVYVDSRQIYRYDIPAELMREMRSSIVFMGAILGRMKRAEVSLPGGCELGPRPIDLHISSLARMGAEFEENHGIISCSIEKGIHSADINLSFPSVGATENIMLAAVCSDGVVTVTTLSGTQHIIIPDRIVTATYMAALSVCGGRLLLKGVSPLQLRGVSNAFEHSGLMTDYDTKGLHVSAQGVPERAGLVRTMPYPGFPTDAQPPVMAMSCFARGTSVFVENVFESRYRHVSELCRMGANIYVQGKVAVVEGSFDMSGATVEAKDLRGGAALVVAGLGASGKTVVKNINYIERGYEAFEENLGNAGADIIKM